MPSSTHGRGCAPVNAAVTALLHVLAPHATAGPALMETASGSAAGLVDALDRHLPATTPTDAHGSTGDGADPRLPPPVSPSLAVPVETVRLLLGAWQRIVLVDLNADNRRRQVRFSFVVSC